MLVRDEELLKLLRQPGKCELCDQFCRVREPAHIFPRGARSWKRIDLPWNLLALGSTPNFQCSCHSMIHNGKISLGEQLAVVCRREGVTPEWIRAEHARLLRELGKGGRSCRS